MILDDISYSYQDILNCRHIMNQYFLAPTTFLATTIYHNVATEIFLYFHIIWYPNLTQDYPKKKIYHWIELFNLHSYYYYCGRCILVARALFNVLNFCNVFSDSSQDMLHAALCNSTATTTTTSLFAVMLCSITTSCGFSSHFLSFISHFLSY